VSAILLIACVGMIAGAFLLLGISPLEFADALFGFLTRRNKSLRAEIDEAARRKKASFFRREITEVQEILKITGRSDGFPLSVRRPCCALPWARPSPSCSETCSFCR